MITRDQIRGAPPYTLDGFHPEFADFAEWMVSERNANWPKLIAAGKMDRRAAQRRIRIMTAIAEIWRSAASGFAPNYNRFADVTRQEIIGELNTTIDGSGKLRARHPDAPFARDRHAALHAMFWWHQRPHYARYVYIAAMGFLLRSDSWAALAFAEEAEAETARATAQQVAA